MYDSSAGSSKPRVYNHLRGRKHLYKKAFFPLLIAGGGIGLFGAAYLDHPGSFPVQIFFWIIDISLFDLLIFWALIVTPICGFFIVRAEWAYMHRPWYCDPEDGMLRISERGTLLLLLSDSRPEPISVDRVRFKTPGRTVFERTVKPWKNVATLTIVMPSGKEEPFTDVVDIGHLEEIQRWRDAAGLRSELETRRLLEQQVEYARERRDKTAQMAADIRAMRVHSVGPPDDDD